MAQKWWKLAAYVKPEIGEAFRELAEKQDKTVSALLGELAERYVRRQRQKALEVEGENK